MQNTYTRQVSLAYPKVEDRTTHIPVGVIGLGYVGLPVALSVSHGGFPVVGFDIDKKKVQELHKKRSTVLSHHEQEMLTKDDTIIFESEPNSLRGCTVYLICVPTPVREDRTPDISALVESSRMVGRLLKPGDLVVVESTIQPGMSEEVIIPLLEHESSLQVEQDFHYAYCPERVNPGDGQYHTQNIPRVIGATDKTSLQQALVIYKKFIKAPITPMQNVREAEAVKMLEDAFRDVNIAFANEIALAFEKEGIDAVNVIKGASTKPFGFMAHYPSCGVGGHLPMDPYMLIEYGERHGFVHHLLRTARRINEHMPYHTIKLVKEAFAANGDSIQGKCVAVLGLSYKKNISDFKESPAIEMLNELRYEGINTVAYDPHVPELSTVSSLTEALKMADAVIIATDHDEFHSLRPENFLEQHVQVVIDGKNCLSLHDYRRSALIYRSIGRITT